MSEELKEPLLLPQHAESLHPQPIDYQASFRARAEPFRQLGEALTSVFREMAKALAPVAKAVAEAVNSALDTLMQAYIEDGAIYGPTSEGMFRWLKEKGEILRLQMEAERIEQHQEAVRDFKRMLVEKRAQQD